MHSNIKQCGPWGWLIADMLLVLFLSIGVTDVSSAETSISLRRQIVHFGSMDSIRNIAVIKHRKEFPARVTLASSSSTRRKTQLLDVDDDDEEPEGNKMWPPWPFNLIGKKKNGGQSSQDGYPSTGALFWAYVQQRSRVGICQIQQRT